MKKLLVLLLCCLSVAIAGDAVNYRTLRFTLPVYEMKSKVTENELVSAIGAKSKNKQGYDVFHEIYYLIDPDTTFSDTSELFIDAWPTTPEYPGGFRAINNFFEENMRYPEQARKQNIEGKVIVKFKIEKDGTITEAFVVRSPDSSLNEEAIRLVKSLPGKWIPAKSSGGKAIDSWFTIPVKFKLEEKL